MFNFIKLKLNYISITSLIILTILVAAAVSAPYIFPDIYMHLKATTPTLRSSSAFSDAHPPTLRYPFGVNRDGINMLELVTWGLRPLMVWGTLAGLMSIITGTFIGIISGYYENKISDNVNRLFDILLPFSSLAMFVFIAFAVGNLNLVNLILLSGMIYWVKIARIIRSNVIKLKESIFLKGANAIGASNVYIIYKYIMKNMYGLLINLFFQSLTEIVMIAAALSYLGINYTTEVAPYDLGRLIAMGYSSLNYAWWESVFPGLILLLFILSLNMIGENLQMKSDILNTNMIDQENI